MERRSLGRSGIVLPKIVLGTMFREPARRETELARLVDAALAAGLSALDTAPLYGFGESEALLGRLLAGRRERITLLGKVGLRWDGGYGEPLFETEIAGRRVAVRRDARPEAIVRDLEESLRRLRTDRLDLVQIHHRDRDTPLAESLGALQGLRDAGKLRAIGVCNFDGDAIDDCQRLLGAPGLASVQNGFSLLDRGDEREVLPRAGRGDFGYLAYSPLSRGILGGRLLAGALAARDGRAKTPLYQPKNVAAIHAAMATQLAPLAQERGVGVAAIALAWVLAVPGVTSAICGAQDERQLADAVAACAVSLTPDEHRRVGHAFSALALDRRAGLPLRARVARRLRRILARLRG